MEDVTRKRIMRKLEQLPEEHLYQILDYIEFLELKYAREASRTPDAFQQFAERLEDQMRVRSLAPKAMKSTMKVVSTAGKVIDGVRTFGKELVSPDRTVTAGETGDGAARDPAGSASGRARRATSMEAGGTAAGRGDAESVASDPGADERGDRSGADAAEGTRAG